VDQAVFDEFAAQASKENKTLFAYANESLKVVARIAAEGGNPADLYALWRSISLLKQIDVIVLPSDFTDELIAKLYGYDRARTLEMFSDLGARLVGILKIAASDLKELSSLAKNLLGLLPIKQFDMREKNDGSVEVDIIGAGRRIESTECTVEFVISVLKGYGYTTTKREVNIGTIRLSAVRRGLSKGL
jgi:hypothetical protein